MPSSSRRKTEQEADLYNAFVMALARLCYANCEDLVVKLINIYEILLDIDRQQLTFNTQGSRTWVEEMETLHKLNRVERIYGAAKVLHECAQMLWKQYGREEESVLCFEFASHLTGVANYLVQEDERVRLAEQDYQDRVWFAGSR